MAKTAIATIKSWFTTGKFPTQDQFWNWMDSYWHKDESLSVANVTGLTDLLNAKATIEQTDNLQTQINAINGGSETKTFSENSSYAIPNGKTLEKIVVIPSGDLALFGIGSTNGGYEIMPGGSISEDDAQVFILNLYANGADRTIWLNGITSETTFKIYTR